MKKTVKVLAYENLKTNEIKFAREKSLFGIRIHSDWKGWVRAPDLDQSSEVNVPDERRVWMVQYDQYNDPVIVKNPSVTSRCHYVREVKDLHTEIVVDLQQLQRAWDECEKRADDILQPAKLNTTFNNFLIRLGALR